MSASRAASSSESGATRARIRLFQSGMCPARRSDLRRPDPRDAVQRREERAPASALRCQHLLSSGGETVEALPPLTALLDPAALNEAAAFEAVQRGVERRDVELKRAVGSLLDQLRELVAVSIALVEQRQDEDFSAALAQLAVVRHIGSICISHTYVNSRRDAQPIVTGGSTSSASVIRQTRQR